MTPFWVWPAAFTALLAMALVAAATSALDVAGALFLAGAVSILVAGWRIGTGGPRMRIAARAPGSGVPLAKEAIPAEERNAELRQGVGLFLVGLALWLTMGAVVWWSRR